MRGTSVESWGRTGASAALILAVILAPGAFGAAPVAAQESLVFERPLPGPVVPPPFYREAVEGGDPLARREPGTRVLAELRPLRDRRGPGSGQPPRLGQRADRLSQPLTRRPERPRPPPPSEPPRRGRDAERAPGGHGVSGSRPPRAARSSARFPSASGSMATCVPRWSFPPRWGHVTRVEIDPERAFPDVDPENNVWVAGGEGGR